MAGTISLSLSQQFDAQGAPLSGGKLYFFQSGTTTPQNAFQDFALTIVHPNPIVLDASGRVPAFYLADGFIKIRLADKDGVTVIAADGLLVIGPSSGGGGGASIDPNSVLATGDIKARYAKSADTLAGFVRCNGRTIGSALSPANERANADCQALFEFLWTVDGNLAVSGGRGASGNADWLANKTIALPDVRGRALYGLDDMGAPAAGRLTAAFFGAAATTLGNAGGSENHMLTSAELAQHTHSITEPNSGQGHLHGYTDPTHSHPITDTHSHSYLDAQLTGGASAQSGPGIGQGDVSRQTTGTTAGAITVNSASVGITISRATTGITINNTPTSATVAHAIASPGMVMMFYIKL